MNDAVNPDPFQPPRPSSEAEAARHATEELYLDDVMSNDPAEKTTSRRALGLGLPLAGVAALFGIPAFLSNREEPTLATDPVAKQEVSISPSARPSHSRNRQQQPNTKVSQTPASQAPASAQPASPSQSPSSEAARSASQEPEVRGNSGSRSLSQRLNDQLQQLKERGANGRGQNPAGSPSATPSAVAGDGASNGQTSPSPSPAQTQDATPAPQAPGTSAAEQPSARPSQAASQEERLKELPAVDMEQDPVNDPSEPPQQPTKTAPDKPNKAHGRGEAYKTPPANATLTGKSPLVNLELKTTASWHLARRTAHAPTPGLVAEIEHYGIEGWIDRQLDPESINDSEVEGIIDRHFWYSKQSVKKVREQTEHVHFVGFTTMNSVLQRARLTNRVLLETVVEVLSDHIFVPMYGKAQAYSGEYDQLLRKNAFGTFENLLHSVLTHPALLIELDQTWSKLDSPNENLGRELLELYTVGVGNYNEDDVRNSALLLTGHSVDFDEFTYEYRANRHYTGPLKVMDFTHSNQTQEGGPEVLREYVKYLSHHPGTAERLARRFAVRYISDNPSQETIDELAKVYLDNDTSLKALVRGTLLHPEFMSSIGAKWKRPLEFISSIHRAAQPTTYNPRGSIRHNSETDISDLDAYGWQVNNGNHLPRNWTAVDGYPDDASYWGNAGIMLTMWNNARSAVHGDEAASEIYDWRTGLAITGGENAMEAARRITWNLTGYEWPEDQVDNIAQYLASWGREELHPNKSTVMDEKDMPGIEEAVRLIFSSPYGFLR